MPDSMFDKLGDLLSDALESGEIPQYETAEAPEDDDGASAVFADGGEYAYTAEDGDDARRNKGAETAHGANSADASAETHRDTHTAYGWHSANNAGMGTETHHAADAAYGWHNAKTAGGRSRAAGTDRRRFTGAYTAPRRRFLSERERTAFRTLGIPENAPYNDAKRLYHEKLQRFHPDKQGDNAVLQKVAQEKTTQFIAAWNVLEAYFQTETQR